LYFRLNIWESDFTKLKTAVPAFLTMLRMPLTFSIATGLTIEFLSSIVIAVFSGDIKKNLGNVVVSLLSAMNLYVSV